MREYFTPREVSSLLGVNERTVYAWVCSGDLKAVPVGRSWRIYERDLEAFLRLFPSLSPEPDNNHSEPLLDEESHEGEEIHLDSADTDEVCEVFIEDEA